MGCRYIPTYLDRKHVPCNVRASVQLHTADILLPMSRTKRHKPTCTSLTCGTKSSSTMMDGEAALAPATLGGGSKAASRVDISERQAGCKRA